MMILFSSDSGDSLPIRHFISLVLCSSCLRLVCTWSFQVRRLSKCIPRYLTVSDWGMFVVVQITYSSFTGQHIVMFGLSTQTVHPFMLGCAVLAGYQKWAKTKSNHNTASEHKPGTLQARYDCHAQGRQPAKRKECISTILDLHILKGIQLSG